MKFTPIALGALLLAGAAQAQDRTLLIYTYDSFISEWGPGPVIEKAFEETCDCDLQFVGAGDGAALLSRLRLEGARSEADIVLGIDTSLLAEAKQTDQFAPHELTPDNLTLPIDWSDDTFLPYDWGHFAFVYDTTKLTDVPTSFEALAAAPDDLKIVIQDPRSSTPGLGLLMWVKAAYGDRSGEIWTGLAPHIVTVTKGWSEAYGMFLEGEADMVLSYTTSPAYHRLAEEDDTKAAATFEEGHYLQVEVAGMLKTSKNPELAQEFLRFMLTDGFQSAIPQTNWMYPAAMPADALPEGFGAPVAPENTLLLPSEDIPALKREALDEWLQVLSR
ncbi:thiamine ABC transporter substrate binding subunit [Halovulum sp. GXIMD14793]